MTGKKEKWRDTLTLAFTIALLPPIWAVISPYLGVSVGAVALICAGLYVAAGNDVKKAIPVSIGFVCGDFWAVIALAVQEALDFPPDAELYGTLFVLGGLAVIIASILERWIYLPAWLCGWAIGLTVMGPSGMEGIGTLPIQVGAAMLAGVWYVGVTGAIFQKVLIDLLGKRR